MPEWPLVAIGDVAALDIDTTEVVDTRSYPIVGVLNRGRGLLYRDPIRGADTAYRALNRVRPGQIVYSRLKAFEGAITVAPLNLGPAYASQEFPTFTCRPNMVSEYFALLTTSSPLWESLQVLSTGMGGRRERVKPSAFLTIRIPLPLMREQRRIVAVMSAVDSHIKFLQAEVLAVRKYLRLLRETLVVDPSAGEVDAAHAFFIAMGRQRSPRRATGPNMVPYLRSANVSDGKLLLRDVKYMDFTQEEQKKFALTAGDVLVSEGSASENAVGMAAVWNDEVAGTVCFQNTLLRFRAIPGVSTPGFTNHWCKWAYESGAFRNASSGTNIKHIGSKRAEKMPVALPSLDRQVTVAAQLDSVERTWRALSAELAALCTARSNLLAALLSQEISVDEAVDKFVKVA